MDEPKNQLAAKLKAANYVMVTVSHDPSVDQLAALIGLTLLLNKAGKHAAAVFSGQVPSTIDFLKPEDTIEKTTDSLRDFIIALDKSKADKLRYKVEDDMVRIFITPYKTSITQEDLDFSQGDFNVDVVVALGVTQQGDLDEAIVTHGRILHDATVATVNISSEGDLGSIHWQNPQASSLSEMMTELASLLDPKLLDNQIATALLTGIVAETDRFSNDKTSAAVMSASAMLMQAGANQQLVATELMAPAAELPEPVEQSEDQDNEAQPEESGDTTVETEQPAADDQALSINHNDEHKITDESSLPEQSAEPEVEFEEEAAPLVEPSVDESHSTAEIEHLSGGSRLITEPPMMGGQLTANSQAEQLEKSGDPLSVSDDNHDGLLTRGEPLLPTPPEAVVGLDLADLPSPTLQLETLPAVETTVEAVAPSPASQQMVTGLTPPPPAWVTPQDNPLGLPDMAGQPADSSLQSLTDLETAVHVAEPIGQASDHLDQARDEVMRALNADPSQPLPPVIALGAQPMVDDLNPAVMPAAVAQPLLQPDPALLNEMPASIPSLPLPPSADPSVMPSSTAFDPATFGMSPEPGAIVPGSVPTSSIPDPNAAPPVPPPIPFNFGAPPSPPSS
ncbi:MAG: hypothetical protein ABIV43_03755 [Candidatus Saccharimonadales bacterium]